MSIAIKVDLGPQSYDILVSPGILAGAADPIRQVTAADRGAILSVGPVFSRYGSALGKALDRAGIRWDPILIPDGESRKNERTLVRVLEKMASFGLKRDSCLFLLGGGVVGDLGGLAAALYMRGIDFVQCPTTLLAQVDASIGGKTAIDLAGVKNLVGAFHQPRAVLTDPRVLASLPERQFRSGLAEVLKYGVLGDAGLFRFLEKGLSRILRRDPRALQFIVAVSCGIKAGIVGRDVQERGERALLNYGHTLGHALEAYYRYRGLTHGEAIAYGMHFAAMLSNRLGLCTPEVVERQRVLLERMGLFRRVGSFSLEEVRHKLRLDKKARKDGTLFILTRKIGLVTIRADIPEALLLSVLTQFQTEMFKSR